jgi:hypothetical protein
MRRLGYQNAVLSVIAVLLAVGAVERRTGAVLEPASAQAQPAVQQDGSGLSNALEQRKVMIGELRAMNARLERIESKLSSGGVEVKIKDLPPLKLPPEVLKRLEMRSEPAPAPENR